MKRVLSTLRVVLGLVVASAFIGGVPGGEAAAQTAPTLGGLQGRAAASGIFALYAPVGLLPISPLAEIGSPDVLATISSGPASFARASVADPGDILANPDAVLALASPDYPAGTIPPYPYRVSASSGIGEPTAESNPAPGLSAKVVAVPTGSAAEATMPAADAPAIASVGSITSTAATATDSAVATVTARTVISDFNLLGVLTIDSIVSDVIATSNGVETTVDGGTVVTGATVLGQAVTIDADGVHGGSPPAVLVPGLGGLLPSGAGDLGDVLEAAGIKVSLVGPVEQVGGASGQLASTGLRIDFELSERTVPAIGTLAEALPPIDSPIPGAPSVEDLVAAARATHLVAVELGRASVSLTARPAAPRLPLTPSIPSVPSVVVPPAAASSLVGVTPAPAPRPAATGAALPVRAAATETPATTLAAGIGALAILVLLTQPFLGDRLARLAGAVLATDDVDVCPREERSE